jgi:hypothetical protein
MVAGKTSLQRGTFFGTYPAKPKQVVAPTTAVEGIGIPLSIPEEQGKEENEEEEEEEEGGVRKRQVGDTFAQAAAATEITATTAAAATTATTAPAFDSAHFVIDELHRFDSKIDGQVFSISYKKIAS